MSVDWELERFIVEMHDDWLRGHPLVPVEQWPRWLCQGVRLLERWRVAEIEMSNV